MNDWLHVRPRELGMGLRDPQSKRTIPDEGATVPNTMFWRQRLRLGDAVEIDPVEIDPAPEPDGPPTAPPRSTKKSGKPKRK